MNRFFYKSGVLIAFIIALLAGSCKKDKDETPPAQTSTGSTSGTSSGTSSGTTSSTTSGNTTGSTTSGTVNNSFSLSSNSYTSVVYCASMASWYILSTSSPNNSEPACLVYLGRTNPTSNGTYTLVPDMNNLSPSQASVAIIYANGNSAEMWTSTSGQLQVTMVGGKVKATWANVPFKIFMQSSVVRNGSGSLTCPD